MTHPLYTLNNQGPIFHCSTGNLETHQFSGATKLPSTQKSMAGRKKKYNVCVCVFFFSRGTVVSP